MTDWITEAKALRDRWREDADKQEYWNGPHDESANQFARQRRLDADELDALIARYEGWVCVPAKPTEVMLQAAADPLKVGSYPRNSSVYKAMIAAAPEPEGRE